MSFASRHNKVNRWNINTQGFVFKKIKDVVTAEGEDVTYKVYGVMPTRSKYGESAAVILENCYVSLPSHMLYEVSKILDSIEDCEAIRAGKVGIEFYSYESKSGNVCYGANWVDL